MDARTEAAAEAMVVELGDLWGHLDREEHDSARRMAEVVLAAADAVEAPLAEQLATALRSMMEFFHGWTDSLAAKQIYDEGIAALAVFDAARADSQGTATKEET